MAALLKTWSCGVACLPSPPTPTLSTLPRRGRREGGHRDRSQAEGLSGNRTPTQIEQRPDGYVEPPRPSGRQGKAAAGCAIARIVPAEEAAASLGGGREESLRIGCHPARADEVPRRPAPADERQPLGVRHPGRRPGLKAYVSTNPLAQQQLDALA